MKKLILPLAVALPFAQVGLADYQAELSYNYEESKTDQGVGQGDDEIDFHTYGGRVYFEQVDTSKGPYAEAAFLDKASSLFVDRTERKDKPAGMSQTETDITTYGADIVLQGKWIVNVLAGDGEDPDDDSVDLLGIEGGLYLDNSSTLTFSYLKEDVDFPDANIDNYAVSYKRVGELAGGSYYNVEADLLYRDLGDAYVIDDVTDLDLAADYYLDKHFSVGAVLGYADFDGDDEITYGVRTTFYFNDKAGINFSYKIEDNDVLADESEVWSAGINIRF